MFGITLAHGISLVWILVGFGSAVWRPYHFVFMLVFLSVMLSPVCSILLPLCLSCPQFYVLQVASLWKGNALRGVGKTPNILSGHPLSPKSPKNKRKKKRKRREAGIRNRDTFEFRFFHGLSQLLVWGSKERVQGAGGGGKLNFW
jgi:hypothetical protein